MLHKLMHKLGWYYGCVVSKTVKDHVLIGFKCGKCGKVEGWHDAEYVVIGELEKMRVKL